MNDADHHLLTIFSAALKREPTEDRAAFLDDACAGSPGLRERVEALLRAHDQTGRFLEPREDRTCPVCGAAIPVDAPRGLCPGCLLGAARLPQESSDPSARSEATLDVEPAGSGRDLARSILDRLSTTLGEVPHILLREVEGASDADPLERPSSPDMPWADRSARLHLFGEIARGGMGAILRGRDVDLGRDLAVKVLLDSHRDSPDMVRRFIEEAQIAGQLQHPGIVPIYELGAFADRRPYFAMKLVKGRTLAALLADRDPSGADQTGLLVTLLQVAQTVAYAHARGVIHRDLKPSNIMVGSFGEVQVMDWGLAKVLPRGGAEDDRTAGKVHDRETVIATARSASGSDHSVAGSILGTPPYMAPEQARGEIEAADERADVFALGSILCEVLTGQPAFTGRTTGEIMRKAALGDLSETWARFDAREVEPELVALAKDCMARERDDRTRDASGLADRLGGYLASMERRVRESELERAGEAARAEEAKHTADAAEARARAERRARRLTVALAASVLVVFGLGAGGFALVQGHRAELARRAFNDQRERSSRAARAAQAIELALDEAERLRSEAKAKPANELAIWTEARASAKRAVELARQGDADASRRDRAAGLLASLERDRATAEAAVRRAEADRAAVAALEAVRLGRAEHGDPKRTDAEYSAAFREVGLDVDKASPDEAGRWIASRSEPVEFAAFLDDWALTRRTAGRDKADWHHLVEAAGAGDPDPWRGSLRAMYDLDEPAAAAEARRLAENSAALALQPATSLVLLSLQLKAIAKAPGEAASVLEQACSRHPDDFWVHFQLSIAESANGGPTGDLFQRLDKAIPHLSAAVALRPRSAMARRLLSTALSAQGNAEQALAEARSAVELAPKDPAALNNLGNCLLGAGRADEAIAAYREALKWAPNLEVVHHNLRENLRSLGRLDGAMAEWREGLKREPRRVALHYDLGWALWSQGRFEEALTEFREVVRLDHAHFQAQNFIGKCLRDLGRVEEAVAAHQASVRLNGYFDYSRYCLGSALEALGRKEEALDQYREAFRLNPRYVEARLALVALLDELGKRDELSAVHDVRIAEDRQTLERRPLDANAHNQLAWSLATHPDPARRDPSAAVEHARKAVALEPDRGDHWNALALAYYRAGQWRESRKACEEAMELREGGNAWDWFVLAMALWRLEEKARARERFDMAEQYTREHAVGNIDLRWFWREAAELLGLPGPPGAPGRS